MITPLKIGDSVTWMQVTKNGSSCLFSEREGKVIDLNLPMVHVKLRNGRTAWHWLADLRRSDEKNHVTELFENLTARANEKCKSS